MKPSKTYTVDEATKALENYCTYQERCHKEVTEKLRQMRMIPEAQEYIILHLIQHNFLNEERFAKTYARSKFNQNKWGKNKIKQGLFCKQISPYNIKTALQEIEEEAYTNTIRKLIEKKANSITTSNVFKKKQKIIRYLLSKGYESDIVYTEVNSLL